MQINFSNHIQMLADKFGDREALVNIERNRRYSFREFHLLTNRIVNAMHEKLNLGLGDCFVNILDNDNMSLIHFATIFKGRATGAFTNFRDALSEHIWQVETCKAKVAFIENNLLESHYHMLRERDVLIVCMDPLAEPKEGVYPFWDLIEGVSDENPNVVHDDRGHCALIRFTGGTTGTGKPAMYCIDNWLGMRDTAFALADRDAWHQDARMIHIAPMSHGSGMFYVPTLYSGGCTVTQNEPDLQQYARNIEAERVTNCFLVPTILYRLLDVADVDLTSLKYIFYGAAPMSPAKLKRLQQKYGNIFAQVYGSTEHFGIVTSLDTRQHIINSPVEEGRLASAGQVTPGVEVVVVDDSGNPVKQGEVGEIWMRSRSVCLGYLDNEDKTAEEFTSGFWKSGDIGYVDEGGFIYIVDRKKDMIISGGFNVYATEVEAVINSHPSVLMSAVVGIPHDEWGEAVHAEIKLIDGAELNEKELKDMIKEKLGRYKSPKSLVIVDELPLSVVGKVLRRKVREKYWLNTERQVS